MVRGVQGRERERKKAPDLIDCGAPRLQELTSAWKRFSSSFAADVKLPAGRRRVARGFLSSCAMTCRCSPTAHVLLMSAVMTLATWRPYEKWWPGRKRGQEVRRVQFIAQMNQKLKIFFF